MKTEQIQYTANTGTILVSTANSNINGTGTLVNVITGALNGTLVERLIIKASTATISRGMIRLYIYDGSTTILFKEVDVNPVVVTGVDQSYISVVPLNFTLQSGYILKASTLNGENFQIIAEGLNWAY